MKIRSTGFDGILLAILSIALLVLLFFGGTHAQSEPTPVTSMEMVGTVETSTTTSSVAPTTTSTVVIAPPAPKPASIQPSQERWDQLAQCECGGNYGCNTGNGFGGAFQFMHQTSYSSWRAYGGEQFSEHPWEASREQQIAVAERIYNSVGWSAWPGCSRKLGFR